MDPRSRRRAQTVAYDGKQMPTGSADDRLCDLDDCPRPSETLVAATDGSVLLVCTSCATSMSAPAARPAIPADGTGTDMATDTAAMPVVRWEDDTAEFPAIRDEDAAPAPARGSGPARPAGRGWSFWLGLVVGVALTLWGLGLLAGDGGAFDGVVTAALGVYVLLNMARPRYRD